MGGATQKTSPPLATLPAGWDWDAGMVLGFAWLRCCFGYGVEPKLSLGGASSRPECRGFIAWSARCHHFKVVRYLYSARWGRSQVMSKESRKPESPKTPDAQSSCTSSFHAASLFKGCLHVWRGVSGVGSLTLHLKPRSPRLPVYDGEPRTPNRAELLWEAALLAL